MSSPLPSAIGNTSRWPRPVHAGVPGGLVPPPRKAQPSADDVAPGTAGAAVLFSSSWMEAAVLQALNRAGTTVRRCANLAALAQSLDSPDVGVALIEDDGPHFAHAITSLRFRGATAIPIVAVGHGATERIISAISQGASDYAVVDDGMEAVVHRARARLMLGRQTVVRPLHFAGCFLDEASRCLRHGRKHVALTATEFRLAWILFEHVGQVVSLKHLSTQVWGHGASVAKRTLEQHVSRLRAKIDRASEGAVDLLQVHAIQNVGYHVTVRRRDGSAAAPDSASWTI